MTLVITPYLPRIKPRKEKNLLSSNEQEEEEVEEVRPGFMLRVLPF